MEQHKPLFFIGLHKVNHAVLFDRSMISINILEHRRSDFSPHDWILDSGAFTRIRSGKGHLPSLDYARMCGRWSRCGNMVAAVVQDWMCEPFILEITGLTVSIHQDKTVQSFQDLKQLCDPSIYIMPVLQGFEPSDYVRHLDKYDGLLCYGEWVGVGSVCKRNSTPASVERVLLAIASQRPDLRLHGFGIKKTALKSPIVNKLLYSCDSLAWSYAARKAGLNPTCPEYAESYRQKIDSMPVQLMLPGGY